MSKYTPDAARLHFYPKRKAITVEDSDCQLSRTYVMGQEYNLDLHNPEEFVLVTRARQVIDAWENGLIWF